MKKIANLLLIALLLTSSLSSCKKDDDTFDSHVMFNGTKYTLVEGFYFSQIAGLNYNHYYFFVTDGLSYNETNQNFEGTGDMISITISTQSQTPSGTHNIVGESGYFFGVTFTNGIPSGGEGNNFAGGTITISISGDIYQIDIDGETFGEGALTGQYKGTLTPFEF